ncbi:hypothetical protein K227x_40780 [Rubripirellula lacrimiformis]|uniref:Uncharacterized protein n=1 Tax=Rubripirellula lacrimiformis TaxID=1930273 RepID=A0A517NEX0_9BACT|nr:hypothetical protein K227x_40780 [Rubripirellula lacrimiformis]
MQNDQAAYTPERLTWCAARFLLESLRPELTMGQGCFHLTSDRQWRRPVSLAPATLTMRRRSSADLTVFRHKTWQRMPFGCDELFSPYAPEHLVAPASPRAATRVLNYLKASPSLPPESHRNGSH